MTNMASRLRSKLDLPALLADVPPGSRSRSVVREYSRRWQLEHLHCRCGKDISSAGPVLRMAIGPSSDFRAGWVSIDIDLIASCESCGKKEESWVEFAASEEIGRQLGWDGTSARLFFHYEASQEIPE